LIPGSISFGFKSLEIHATVWIIIVQNDRIVAMTLLPKPSMLGMIAVLPLISVTSSILPGEILIRLSFHE